MKKFITLLLSGAIALSVTSQTKPKETINPPQQADIDPGSKPGDLGRVTFTYQGKKVTYATVRANDGNIWLQQNLGSPKVAAQLRDRDAFGDNFQWGRWDDGHQLTTIPNTRAGAPTPNNPAGLSKTDVNPFYYDVANLWWAHGTIKDHWNAASPDQVTADNGCDPCKALGAGWHIPSMDEMENMVKLENITDENGAYVSHLKLTLGGVRKAGYNVLFDASRSGCYWTGSGFKDGIGAALDVPSGQVNGYDRGNGYSIRCMKSKIK